jgi:quinol monooxygenase YgiN
MSDTDDEAPHDVDISILTATFDAEQAHIEALAAVLARYVVMTRHETHCRNVDLVVSTTVAGRFLVIQKWGNDAAARRHLDSFVIAEMAREAIPLLATQPTIDLYDSISAHDLA